LILAVLILVVVIAAVVIFVFVINKKGTTLRWHKPLSEYGSYLGEGDLPDTTTSQYGWKRIVYTDINGETAYADPYKKGSITTAEGTDVILQMYTAEAISYPNITTSQCVALYRGGKQQAHDEGDNGKLISAPYTPPSSGKLVIRTDGYTSQFNIYTWHVDFQ
jgi:hypothetical protein